MEDRACSPPVLSRGVVHMWSTCLARPSSVVSALLGVLSSDERDRADRYHFPEHRDRFIVARGVLRSILAGYLEIPAERVEFNYEPGGKPILSKRLLTRMLTFNLSHSDDWAVYAIGVGRAIGIDLEHVRVLPDVDRIARTVCSVREQAALDQAPPSAREEMLLTYWTCKEAYAKARGDGLACRLPGIEVELCGDAARFSSVGGREREAARWRLERLSPAPGYLGALVVEGHDWIPAQMDAPPMASGASV